MTWRYFEELNSYGFDWPVWVIMTLLVLIILPGIRTDFGGELVWWEPWFLYLFRKNCKEREE